MATRQELILTVGKRYREASRGQRSDILDEFTKITGYHRKHAIRVLSKASSPVEKTRNTRPRIYDEVVVEVLILLWEASDRLCGKRLRALIPSLLTAMERHGHLDLDASVKDKLLTMSAASIDRALKPTRTKVNAVGKRRQGSGNIFKRQIPVRTYSDWNDPAPGFMEVDLVEHCGGVKQDGNFVHSLVMIDIASGWTECFSMQARNQLLVVEGIAKAQSVLPFNIIGIDTDNGSEFINEVVFTYCQGKGFKQTRSRPYRKNDQAWVEQKNGAIVRRMVGYNKLTGTEACRALQELYDASRLFVNFFQPSFKLKTKLRQGAHVQKKYHLPQTPCERLLARADVEEQSKEALRQQLSTLDPVNLLKLIRQSQQKLTDLSSGAKYDSDNTPETVDLTDFLRGLSQAWKIGEIRPTHREKLKPQRTWRTRTDPFEADWPMIEHWMELDSSTTAKEIMQRLIEVDSDKYSQKSQLRTLQRRIKDWRTEKANQLIFGPSAQETREIDHYAEHEQNTVSS